MSIPLFALALHIPGLRIIFGPLVWLSLKSSTERYTKCLYCSAIQIISLKTPQQNNGSLEATAKQCTS